MRWQALGLNDRCYVAHSVMGETDRTQFHGNEVRFKVQAKNQQLITWYFYTTVNKYINICALISTLWDAWWFQPWPCVITTIKWNSTSPYPKRADSKHVAFSGRLLWRVVSSTIWHCAVSYQTIPRHIPKDSKLQTSKALLQHGRNHSYHSSIKTCVSTLFIYAWNDRRYTTRRHSFVKS
jgi:hypothetical protein